MPTHRAFLDQLRTADVPSLAELLAADPELARARDDSWGDAALSTAVARDDAALVQLLVDAGADPNESVDPDRAWPFFTFARSVAVAEVLARSGAVWTDPNHGAAALSTAARAADRTLVVWLLARGARPNADPFRGARYDPGLIEPMLAVCTPDVRDALLADCLDGEPPEHAREIVAFLLRAGADPTQSDALHRAAALDLADVVRLLLGAGADPNAPDAHGELAIIGAAYEGAHDVVRVLLNAGADPDRTNRHGQNARQAATELADPVLLRMIDRPRGS